MVVGVVWAASMQLLRLLHHTRNYRGSPKILRSAPILPVVWGCENCTWRKMHRHSAKGMVALLPMLDLFFVLEVLLCVSCHAQEDMLKVQWWFLRVKNSCFQCQVTEVQANVPNHFIIFPKSILLNDFVGNLVLLMWCLLEFVSNWVMIVLWHWFLTFWFASGKRILVLTRSSLVLRLPTIWISRACWTTLVKQWQTWSRAKLQRKFGRLSTSRMTLHQRKRRKFAEKTNGLLSERRGKSYCIPTSLFMLDMGVQDYYFANNC